MDPQATFLKRFGDLVMLLRREPANDAAQDLALSAVGAAIAHGPVRIEAGVETSAIPDAVSLQARLRARHVDCIDVDPEVDLSELLGLARALAHDTMPLPANPHIEVTTVPVVHRDEPDPPSAPPTTGSAARSRRQTADRRIKDDRRRAVPPRWPGLERRHGPDRRVSGERRAEVIKDLRAEAQRFYDRVGHGVSVSDWDEVLDATLGIVRLTPRVPHAERRLLGIQVRRLFQRRTIESLIDGAERDPSVRARTVEVLTWLGVDAAEVMVDRLRSMPALGPRAFMLDAIGRVPDAFPLVAPLLRSARPQDVYYGALLAAKLNRSDTAPLLAPHVDHPDVAIRVAVVQALGEMHGAAVGDVLRATLHHPCPETRATAATAIAGWRAGALDMLLAAAVATERNRLVWQALVDALGQVGSAAACAMLGTIALTRRSLFQRHGYSRDQRLAAVAALARVDTPAARATLQRLVREADDDVRQHARRAVG